jgi:DNA-binding NarL/FixJ family response regulator
MSIAVLLVDDHRVVRQGLRCLLDAEANLEVVGEAGDGEAALRLAEELSPDVVIIEGGMRGLGGVETTRRLRTAAPSAKVLVLSVHAQTRHVSSMLKAGASGYLPKTCDVDELVRAIRTVAAGQRYLSPEVTGVLIDEYVGETTSAPRTSATLSGREREVLRHVADGLASKEIASRLHLSPKTIEMHRRNIMRKLDIHSVAELTKYAVREGITSIENGS